MTNRRLIHVRIESEFERIIPVNLHWLETDHVWMDREYAAIVDELCKVVAENVEEFEKRIKNETKIAFKRVAGHSKVSMAVAVKHIEPSNHSVFVIGKVNDLFQNTNYSLSIWIGPKKESPAETDAQWPIDCVL